MGDHCRILGQEFVPAKIFFSPNLELFLQNCFLDFSEFHLLLESARFGPRSRTRFPGGRSFMSG